MKKSALLTVIAIALVVTLSVGTAAFAAPRLNVVSYETNANNALVVTVKTIHPLYVERVSLNLIQLDRTQFTSYNDGNGNAVITITAEAAAELTSGPDNFVIVDFGRDGITTSRYTYEPVEVEETVSGTVEATAEELAKANAAA